MKKIFLLLSFQISSMSFAQLMIYDSTSLDKIAEAEANENTAFFRSTISLAPTSDYNIKYHRLQWNINPQVKFIQGCVTSFFEPTVNNFQTIHFDMSDFLHVDSIYYHQNNISFTQPLNDILSIQFASILTQNVLDSVSVFYSGTPTSSGFGSFRMGTHGDSVAGFDSVMWTLSEPYGSRDWWPGKMTLTDKIDSLDIYVTLPNGNTVATNGLPVDTFFNTGSTTFHWQHRYPIANYLICFAATNYDFYIDTVQTSAGVVPIYNFWYPEFMPFWLQWKPDDHQFMRLFTNLFGAYPFINEKYGHAQMNAGGGMEHQTMTFVHDQNFELINHEMAHHWFGDKLTCGSWEDIWLNEGWATYCSVLCYEYMSFPVDYYSKFKMELLNKIIAFPDGSVFCDDTNSVSRIFNPRLSYAKGAYLLHMLRWKIGDDNFFTAVKNYVADNSIEYNFCKTDDLKFHLEQQSGQNLDEFFNDWFYGQGYPTYGVDWAQDASKNVSLILRQTTSHPSVSFYEMPVPIKFKNSTHDTIVVFNNTSNNQNFETQLSFFADSAFVDPENWILKGTSKIRKLPALGANEFVLLRPNPTGNNFQVWYDAESITIQNLYIYDVTGRVVKSIPLEPVPVSTIDISIAELPDGIYFLKIQTPLGYVVRKLIKN